RQTTTAANSNDLIIAPGATGADTIMTNSAAGGNASFPERAVPNASANGGGGGTPSAPLGPARPGRLSGRVRPMSGARPRRPSSVRGRVVEPGPDRLP
ncbi:hypothetical protein ACLBXP_25910, partial [Methylobacterium sp. A54F]